jgi:hypothetical protein
MRSHALLYFVGHVLNEIDDHFRKISKIAESFGGLCAGEKNGKLGYNLTFVIAYIRVRMVGVQCKCDIATKQLIHQSSLERFE